MTRIFGNFLAQNKLVNRLKVMKLAAQSVTTNLKPISCIEGAPQMIPTLRPYQEKLVKDTYQQWDAGKQFVAMVSSTGSGKSMTLTAIVAKERDRGQYVLVLAHRQELITQLSDTMGRMEIRHQVIAANKVVRFAAKQSMENHGVNYVDPNARVMVASVQSMREAKIADLAKLGNKLTVVQDEFHHATKKSKTWGGVLTPLLNAGARGLGPTATPCRADGQGLSRETDGYADVIVEGPSMRWLIDNGYLSQYKIYCPPTDLRLDNVETSKTTGDYKEKELKAEIGRSHIVGDIVSHYLKICPGKRGITFTVGVDTAEEVAEEYRKRGVPAIALSGRNADEERVQAIRDLKSGKILQIVNDSLIGEGVDIPAVEVVSFARPTQSYALYAQMFGRALRPFEGKSHAIIIDAVSNVMRHGLPDAPREWSLDRRERRTGKSEPSTVRVCTACAAVYERFLDACPDCGEPVPKPAQRSGPEFVDGDLYELDPDVLAQMRNEVVGARETPEAMRDRLTAMNVPPAGVMANVKRQKERLDALVKLDVSLSVWAGYRRAEGLSDSEIFRKFYLTYGVSWLEAQALKAADADKLRERIGL
ncbi:putative DNA helicase [Klebsiella phage vB_KpnM_JustaPhage]|uniref:DNA helicase n=1 Tax=Klebsiella phage vB_KpnM_JustaPhage TaxID=2894801 RepID=A0AAE9CCQ8_9CAUD|nr:putative DNA helicase [Klebsiella phage vB_KpnM_JustaPhage]UGO49404.1 putative DNA helicase [Klebsiella phage vB_KpnM_JustaPhage]